MPDSPSFDSIVIDLDGTLLDVRKRITTCYRDLCLSFGLVPLPEETYWKLKRDAVDRRQILARSGDPAGDYYDPFLKGWLANIEDQDYLALDALHPDVAQQLGRWSAEGRQLTLATMRQSRARAIEQLERFGIFHFFDNIIVSSHATGPKGKALAVREAIGSPTSCIWIGDTESDVLGARHFGCRSWAVSSGLRTMAYLRALGPDYLSECVGAVDLVTNRSAVPSA